MEALLKNIERKPDLDTDLQTFLEQFEEGQTVTITYLAESNEPEYFPVSGDSVKKGREYIVTVKKWMTQKTTNQEFNFMSKWNDNIPMPVSVMQGRVLSETRGMVFMDLHSGDTCWKGWVAKSAIEYAVEVPVGKYQSC